MNLRYLALHTEVGELFLQDPGIREEAVLLYASVPAFPFFQELQQGQIEGSRQGKEVEVGLLCLAGFYLAARQRRRWFVDAGRCGVRGLRGSFPR